jgi:hypothetical protein
MIRPNIASRSKIIVEQHFSLTEQRLKVLAKTLTRARFLTHELLQALACIFYKLISLGTSTDHT